MNKKKRNLPLKLYLIQINFFYSLKWIIDVYNHLKVQLTTISGLKVRLSVQNYTPCDDVFRASRNRALK